MTNKSWTKDDWKSLSVVFGVFCVVLVIAILLFGISIGRRKLIPKDLIIEQGVCEDVTIRDFDLESEFYRLGASDCIFDEGLDGITRCYFWKWKEEWSGGDIQDRTKFIDLCKKYNIEFGEVQNYYYCKFPKLIGKVCTTQKEVCWEECKTADGLIVKIETKLIENIGIGKGGCKTICTIQYEK